MALFDETWKMVLFYIYVGFFVSLGLLVTASPRNAEGEYDFNPVTVVLLAELTKLCVSAGIYVNEGNTLSKYVEAVRLTSDMFKLYLIPAGLYAVYNLLMFYNLSNFDPASYFMFLQLRSVGTGVVFGILFNRKLSPLQWLSLVLVTVGCIVQGGKTKSPDDTTNQEHSFLALILMLVQVACTCTAGVVNEYLLKGNSGSAHPMVQNAYMYGDSIAMNIVLLTFRGQLLAAFSPENLGKVLGSKVLVAVILVQAAAGVTSSLFLKHLNSILKTFATALEIVGSAIAAWLFFGLPITGRTGMAIVIICAAIFIYAANPVPQPPDLNEPEPDAGKKQIDVEKGES